VLLVFAATACFRDRASDAGAPTEAEHTAFALPADSSLTAKQVDQYLRTTLAHFDMLQAEFPAMRNRVAAARQRPAAAPPGRPRPKSASSLWNDEVEAAYVRSARKLGYNPAELVYVRNRMSDVAGHLQAGDVQISTGDAAALLRQQAEAMRGTPGVAQADIDRMLKAADQAETQRVPPAKPRRLVQNLAALRQARGRLSEAAWARVARVAAGDGVSELGPVPEEQVGRTLDELRRLYRDALANREPPPPGSRAKSP
jgi:hypothetical protein